jgi:hypothetical protein
VLILKNVSVCGLYRRSWYIYHSWHYLCVLSFGLFFFSPFAFLKHFNSKSHHGRQELERDIDCVCWELMLFFVFLDCRKKVNVCYSTSLRLLVEAVWSISLFTDNVVLLHCSAVSRGMSCLHLTPSNFRPLKKHRNKTLVTLWGKRGMSLDETQIPDTFSVEVVQEMYYWYSCFLCFGSYLKEQRFVHYCLLFWIFMLK